MAVFLQQGFETLIVGYVNNLGYLYCTNCHAGGFEGERYWHRDRNDHCDGCGRPMAESLETVPVTYTLESTPAKIF